MTGLSGYGIDELYRLREAADLHNDTDWIEAIDKELSTRSIDTYNEQQAEAQFGA